jgi:hypothetical protein
LRGTGNYKAGVVSVGSKVKVVLAAESHPSCDHHYVFSAECLDRFAEQAVGLPVRVNFQGLPVGRVEVAERTSEGVVLEFDVPGDIAERVASPGFVARDADWNEDFSERVIVEADEGYRVD